ncbi:hypothetical protein OIU85_002682 [Salix viminalis]|uniref:Uncharacterized protein n=1 Tax=Salix viminalis TaxID=40686 RepID=A0A9Q0ZZ46_SALVM|nr:hypothetical protein OIU85_002682 [Salix viminalis]
MLQPPQLLQTETTATPPMMIVAMQRRMPILNSFLGIEDIHAYLAHLTEELDEAEAESAKISNEIELLNSTYMEDSSELESDLEWMKCSLVEKAVSDPSLLLEI